jgi:hypothetical protein
MRLVSQICSAFEVMGANGKSKPKRKFKPDQDLLKRFSRSMDHSDESTLGVNYPVLAGEETIPAV